MALYFTPIQMLFALFLVPDQAVVLAKMCFMALLNLFDAIMMT